MARTTSQYGIFTVSDAPEKIVSIGMRLTPPEFNAYLKAKHPTEIIYTDENNGEYKRKRITHKLHEPTFLSLIFDGISYCSDGNTYILKSRQNLMRISFVKYIEIEASILGEVATLHCKYDNSPDLIAYTLIIR